MTKIPNRIVVPCDVEIRRFYRVYVTVEEDASPEEILRKAKAEILEHQDYVLIPDFELDIEDHDILNAHLDLEGQFEVLGEDTEDSTSSLYGDYTPANHRGATGMNTEESE